MTLSDAILFYSNRFYVSFVYSNSTIFPNRKFSLNSSLDSPGKVLEPFLADLLLIRSTIGTPREEEENLGHSTTTVELFSSNPASILWSTLASDGDDEI